MPEERRASIRASTRKVRLESVRPGPCDRPTPRVSPAAPGGCPVDVLAHQTLASARSLTRMLRKLGVSMTNCRACFSKANCPILVDFNAQLAIALQEVTDEWALA